MTGKVEFEIVSGLYCDFIGYLTETGIQIYSIKSTEFGIKAVCNASDYKKIARLAKRYQCRTKITAKKGIYFKVRKIFRRKGLVMGTALVFLCLYLFSHIVWRIDVISPSRNITEDVYSILYSDHMYAGSIFSQEKNNRLIQRIFLEVDDVGYVTMNFYKGVLTCKIDPAIEKLPYLEDSTSGNITATESGVIEDLRVYRGFSQVQAGQSVFKGDILVSSTYLDRNGTVQQVMPRAYIKALCQREYTAQIAFEKDIWVRTGEECCQKTLKILGMDIVLQKTQIDDWAKFDMEKTFENVSFMGFRLPMTTETIKYYNKYKMHISKDENQAFNAGVKIIDEMIKNDKAVISVESKEYFSVNEGDSVTATCKVTGYYNITK